MRNNTATREYCDAVNDRGQTCAFGVGHTVEYHLWVTPREAPMVADPWSGGVIPLDVLTDPKASS